jgi:uncharacterized protein (TIGR02001 family)
MPRTRTRWKAIPAYLAAPLLALPFPRAHADIGGSASLQSDGLYRGISYSNHRTQGQLTLSWDGDSGWYAGTLATQARFSGQRSSPHVQLFAGHVARLWAGVDAEAGITSTRFTALSKYDYAEAYLGLLGDRWSARLHYADDYFGSQQRSLYGELNLHMPLAPAVQAYAHLGLIHGRGGPYTNPHGPTRLDLRLGLVWRIEAVELQAAWVAASRGGPYTWADESRRQTVVLGASAAF